MKATPAKIPIFVSSTVYGLEDLRGELASFLEDLGAEPLLSSESGFPDHRGIPPYVQCLRVLEERALIVIGIIDKRYGKGFDDWGPYPQYQGLSPTHAELRHALNEGKHLLIYVRSDIQSHYDIYRKNRELFASLDLPANLELKTLEMFSEIKLASPVPWIETFRDIRDIKRSIRSRLLHYLLEALIQKERLAQVGSDILVDRILKADRRDLDAVGKVLAMLEDMSEERKDHLRALLEDLYSDELASTSPISDQDVPLASSLPPGQVREVASSSATKSIERLVDIGLNASRTYRDRRIAEGILASAARTRELGDEIVRELQKVMSIETDRTRLGFAASTLSLIYRAKEARLELGSHNVLIVDDNLGEIIWLMDFAVARGYQIATETSEKAAKRRLDAVKKGEESYVLAIIDMMIPMMDFLEMDEFSFDDSFFENSSSSGLRLFRYARHELEISPEDLPMVCLTVREDEEIRLALKDLGIPLFQRVPLSNEESIRPFLESKLPMVRSEAK